MKRLSVLLLALCLTAGLAAPALAMTAPDMEAELAVVTAQVKETLQVDDDYTQFYGDYYEELRLTWSLNWSDADRSLSVTCDENGTVLDVYAYGNEQSGDRFYGFDPAFPALDRARARALAEAWMIRLLGEGETARIDSESVSLSADGYYTFHGTVLLHGVESPIAFHIRIDENGLRSYNRSDGYSPYAGEVAAPVPEVSQLSAAVNLGSALELELFYVLDEATNTAGLQYVPVGPYTVVDAATGDVVDMDALYASFEESGTGMAAETVEAAPMAAADTERGAGLTAVEQAAIANYGDVLDQEALDGILRGVAQLGITGDFSVDRCSYAMNGESGDVTASLRYTAAMTDQELYGFTRESYDQALEWGDSLTIYKYITVNAKTAEILSVSTSYPLWEQADKGGKTESALKKNAEAFLEQCAGEMFDNAKACTLMGCGHPEGLVYTRVENGYFYPENYLFVEMNPSTGTVDGFRRVWDEDVTFGSARGLVSPADAASAYADALDVTLGYVAWPEEIREDDTELLRYLDWGYTWVESLRLGYYYSGLDTVSGVDAITGEVLVDTFGETGTYTYTDLALTDAREEIEALGQAGIGFAGGKFRPSSILTQRDAVTLLLQAAGYDTTTWSDEGLCSEAVWLGLVTEAEWNPGATMSRMDFLKMLLGASLYGAAAELSGVWSTTFTDVSDADMGYAAMAQALGILSGEELNPISVCLRGDAAEMLYGFMNR